MYYPCLITFFYIHNSFVYPKDCLNALHLATCCGHLDIVKYIIPKLAGRRFDSDKYDSNCLHWSAREGHLSIVKYLIKECGFDPSTVTKVFVSCCLLHVTHIVHHLQYSYYHTSGNFRGTRFLWLASFLGS